MADSSPSTSSSTKVSSSKGSSKGSGEVISFLCPQGHKLSVSIERGGRITKCPKCDTLFQVPKPSKEGAKKLIKAQEMIEFLCPNGHYLQGPVKLEGTRGQCPHCNERFQIPRRDEDEMLQEEEQDEVNAPEDSGKVTQLEQPDEDDIDELPEAEPEDLEEAAPVEPPGGSSIGPPIGPPPESLDFSFVDQPSAAQADAVIPGATHAMGSLFEALWEGADPEAIIELHLADGEIIAPLNYAHDLSRGQHGVFASKGADGKQTITVVAWEKVNRVTVRGLENLPQGMFE